jgi:uncharacterized protein (DUF169 family)
MYVVNTNWKKLASDITRLLNLKLRPIAITFSDGAPKEVPPFEGAMPEPTADGRTGKVPAGCVFWAKSVERTFTTVPEDHGNCSVGCYTHGLKTLNEISENSDVSKLLECGWVTEDMLSQIPAVKERSNFVTYGPLEDTAVDPDVVLIFINGIQAMLLHDSVPDMHIEGKPQCHIIPMAKERKQIAMSVGCMLSRVRTGMAATEMTCAIPAIRLTEVISSLEKTRMADSVVATYASEDTHRFAS